MTSYDFLNEKSPKSRFFRYVSETRANPNILRSDSASPHPVHPENEAFASEAKSCRPLLLERGFYTTGGKFGPTPKFLKNARAFTLRVKHKRRTPAFTSRTTTPSNFHLGHPSNHPAERASAPDTRGHAVPLSSLYMSEPK